MTLLSPHRAHPRRDRAAATGATCPGRRTARGTRGKSPELPAASHQKTPGMRITYAKPPTPLGFSTLHSLCLSRGRRGKERVAAAPRRERKETGTRSRERGAGSEEPGARAGAEEDDRRRGHLHHWERLHRPEHLRHATNYPESATTTLPPHCEHRPANLFSPPPWSLSCDGSTTSRCVARLYMPGCWPSSRRTAVPRWRGLLSRSCSWAPPSPCEEGVWDRPTCRVFLCRECWARRRLALSCVSGYQMAAPRGHGEAARAQAWSWPRTMAHSGLGRRLALCA
jgi:hypothetical protein